jgi:hypothetical protein
MENEKWKMVNLPLLREGKKKGTDNAPVPFTSS